MPRFTIDLTDAAVTALQEVVARYNQDNGAALTVQQWLILHVKELAIAGPLSLRAQQLRDQTQRDLDAAVAAERQRLLDAL